MFFQKKKI